MPEEFKKAEEKEEEKKKTPPKGLKRLIGFGFLAVIIVAGVIYGIHSMQYQSTEDAYVESHMVQVAPKVSGEVVEVYINDNQKVKKGDIVAKIDSIDYRIRYEQADANYKKALLNQHVAKANLSATNSEINLAKTDLDRYKKLYATGAVSKQTLDDAQTKYDTVQARQTTADQQILSSAKNKVADADLKALKSLRDQAEQNLKYTVIRAPQDGTITNKRVEQGAFWQVGQPMFVLVPDEVWVVANFKESQVGLMKAGQAVEIKVDTYPNKVFKGKVDSIQRASGAKSSLFPPENAVGSFVKIVQRIPVKIVFTEEIDPAQYTIVSGMSVIPSVKVK